MNGLPQTPSLSSGTFRQWRRAIALVAFLTCLTIVWFWPRSPSAHGVIHISIFFLIAALAVAGLTYWHPVRVQVGRRKLRYKAVRYRAFRIFLLYSTFIGSWAIALWLTPNSKNGTSSSAPDTINVTIARLPGDSGDRLQEDLHRALASLSGIGVSSASIAGSEAPRGAVPGFFEHENAESCLRAAHGDLLLWGKINGATSDAVLYETGLDEWMQFGATFNPHDFKLPELPSNQLIPVVKLMIGAQSLTFHLGNLSSLAAVIPSLIAPVRAMADSNSAPYSPDTRARLNYIVGRALMLQGSLLWQEMPIRSSIAYCLTAIALWPSPGYNSERGMVLDSLAQALRELGLVDDDVGALGEAARAAAAAALYSPESDPLNRAAMLQQTGAMMRLLASNGHSEALPRALASFQAAAEVFTQESYPEQWASLQDDIGMTEAALALRTPGTDDLRAAIDAFNQALTVRTRAREPWEWAITQQLLGHALITLGERDPSSGGSAQAVACDRSTLEVLTAENDPDDWSNAEIDLGTALGSIAEARGQADQMLEAANQMRAGATARLRERDPAAWVNAQAALSSTLNQLGQLEWRQEHGNERYASQLDRSAQEHFEKSVAAARAGLAAVSEHEGRNMWGYLQDEQASVLEEIGSREAANHDDDDAISHLREAVAADRAALRALNVTEAPDNWADAQHDLGDSLTDLSDFEPDSSDLQQAVAAYRNAMTIETLARSPDYWAPIQNSLGLALEKLGLRTHGEAGLPSLQQAIDAFRAAEQVSTPDSDLDSWLTTQDALARPTRNWAIAKTAPIIWSRRQRHIVTN